MNATTAWRTQADDTISRLVEERDRYRRERAHIAEVLRAFHEGQSSCGDLMPSIRGVLDLAEALNPDLVQPAMPAPVIERDLADCRLIPQQDLRGAAVQS